MFREDPIRTKEVEAVVALVVVAAGATPTAAEAEAVAEEVEDPTRTVGTSITTSSLEVIINGTTITTGEGAAEAAGLLTTIIARESKEVKFLPALGSGHDVSVSLC